MSILSGILSLFSVFLHQLGNPTAVPLMDTGLLKRPSTPYVHKLLFLLYGIRMNSLASVSFPGVIKEVTLFVAALVADK